MVSCCIDSILIGLFLIETPLYGDSELNVEHANVTMLISAKHEMQLILIRLFSRLEHWKQSAEWDFSGQLQHRTLGHEPKSAHLEL